MPIPLIVDLHQFFGWLCGGRARNSGHVREPRFHCQPVGMLRLTGARRLVAGCWPPRCFRRAAACAGFRARRSISICAASVMRTCRGTKAAHRPRCVALRFAPPVDDLIRQLKYHGVFANARVLGVLLAQAAGERAAPLPRLLVPVPLHDARLRERGFNQARRSRVTRAECSGIPFAPRVVRRVRDTPSQTSLDVDERHRNVRGAFAVSGARARRRLLAAGHVAIVDDVITTGSTVAELQVRAARGGSQARGSCGRWRRVRCGSGEPELSSAASSGGPSNFRERHVAHVADVLHAHGRRVEPARREIAKLREELRGRGRTSRRRLRRVADVVGDGGALCVARARQMPCRSASALPLRSTRGRAGRSRDRRAAADRAR